MKPTKPKNKLSEGLDLEELELDELEDLTSLEKEFKKEDKLGNYSLFVQDFLQENPENLLFCEIGMVLNDYIRAYELQKTKGDIPSNGGGFLYGTFQNCLFSAFTERSTKISKWQQ